MKSGIAFRVDVIAELLKKKLITRSKAREMLGLPRPPPRRKKKKSKKRKRA